MFRFLIAKKYSLTSDKLWSSFTAAEHKTRVHKTSQTTGKLQHKKHRRIDEFMTLLGLFSIFFVDFIHRRLIWDRQTIDGSSSNSSQSVITELKVFINFYLIHSLCRDSIQSENRLEARGNFAVVQYENMKNDEWKSVFCIAMKNCIHEIIKTAFGAKFPWKYFTVNGKVWRRKVFEFVGWFGGGFDAKTSKNDSG